MGRMMQRQQLRGRMKGGLDKGPEEARRRESNTGEVWLD